MFKKHGRTDSRVHSANYWNKRFSGARSSALNKQTGYEHVSIFGALYYAHRVSWAIYYGKWPKGHIDHEQGDRSDNRISKMRNVTQVENAQNMKRFCTNTSGVTGVTWDKAVDKWAAQIKVNYVTKNLGRFTNKSDAIAARKAAEVKYGFHPNHGRD